MTKDADFTLSLVRGDALYRLQRRIGLIPEEGLGLGRRMIGLALFCWLPIAVSALLAGRALPGEAGEPLLRHFGIHARCLIAIPLFVLAEGVAHGLTTRLLPHLVRSGVVSEADRPRFRKILVDVARLRDRVLPWMLILGLVLTWQAFGSPDRHEVIWTEGEAAPASLGFGEWWYIWVARPIFIALLFGWLWRLVVLCVLFLRIGKLDLSLVPTHPDRACGLGFLEKLPMMFSPVVFALSSVFAARWGHDVLYHGVNVNSLRGPMGAAVVINLLLFLAPLLIWIGPLAAAKRRALLEYGALVGEHGRLVRERWILGEKLADDALLGAQEIGPVADTITLYDAVRKQRPVPISLASVLPIALAAIVPMLPVLAIQIPLKDLLLKLLKTLA